MRSFSAGQGAVSPGQSCAALTLALGGNLLLGCGFEGSFSPSSTSPLDRAFPVCTFSAPLARAGWMLVHHPLPRWHSGLILGPSASWDRWGFPWSRAGNSALTVGGRSHQIISC